MLPAHEEIELLRRIGARERNALQDIYVHFAPPLYSIAVRILGDASEAEDVIQDVFVQIWEKATSYDSTAGTPFHWALSITRNRSIDRLRARQRRTRLMNNFEESFGNSDANDSQTPLAGSEMSAIRSAVTLLPADQRAAIELAFFSGKTHHEIAEQLGQPLGTIKARIRRGMLKLRDSLEAYV
jgi:RNA polymerase sigma-70 factor (ECF subfamily)